MAEFVIEDPSGSLRVVCAEDRGFRRVSAQARVGDAWRDVAQINPESCWGLAAGDEIYPARYSGCAQPARDRLCLEGTIVAAGHEWKVADEIAFEFGMVKITRRWRHDHDQTQAGMHLCLGVRIRPGSDLRIMLPGINYNNNPNAEPKRLVPRFANDLPTWGLYEEHRFPIPMVHFESEKDGARTRASLLSVPSPIAYGMEDQWWSLGAKIGHDHVDLLIASGMVGTNGQFGVVYGRQNALENFGDPSLDAPGRAEFRKTAYLDVGAVETPGYGFAQTVWRAFNVLQPTAQPKRSVEETIHLKLTAARARYYEEGDVAGFLCLPEKNVYGRPPYFLWGWTGQSFRIAWDLFEIGESAGDAELVRMAQRSVDFFVNANLPVESGLTYLRYLIPDRKWEANESPQWGAIVSSRQFGETMTNFADILLQKERPVAWRKVLEKAARFLARPESLAPDGLFPRFWNFDGTLREGVPTGTAGVSCVSPLAKAAKTLGDPSLAECAARRLAAYYEYNAKDLKVPYWGGTLDACCEEKEAAIAFLRAALDVYDATGDRAYLDWARMAAEWVLTFIYLWDAGFREGTPCHGRMRTTGWCSVSVQNQHIDVYAPCAEFFRLGESTGDARFSEMGRTLFHAMTQSIAAPGEMWDYDAPDRHNVAGEQAEQFFQTNYYQGRTFDRAEWRGGFNSWNPSWIIAHVLWQAIEMKKRGYGP